MGGNARVSRFRVLEIDLPTASLRTVSGRRNSTRRRQDSAVSAPILVPVVRSLRVGARRTERGSRPR